MLIFNDSVSKFYQVLPAFAAFAEAYRFFLVSASAKKKKKSQGN